MSMENKSSYDDLSKATEHCAKNYLGKLMFALLAAYILFIASIVAFAIPFIFVTALQSQVQSAVVAVIISLVTIGLLYALFLFLFMIINGLFVYASKIVEKDDVKVSMLFWGFTHNPKKAVGISSVFSVLFIIFSGIVAGVFYYIYVIRMGLSLSLEEFNVETISSIVSVMSYGITVLEILIFGPIIFAFLISYNDSKAGVFASIKKSISMLWGKFFHFVGFVIYSCWFELIVIYGLQFFINLTDFSNEFILNIFNAIAFLCRFSAIAKALIASSVYFYNLNGNITFKKQIEESSSENNLMVQAGNDESSNQ